MFKVLHSLARLLEKQNVNHVNALDLSFTIYIYMLHVIYISEESPRRVRRLLSECTRSIQGSHELPHQHHRSI